MAGGDELMEANVEWGRGGGVGVRHVEVRVGAEGVPVSIGAPGIEVLGEEAGKQGGGNGGNERSAIGRVPSAEADEQALDSPGSGKIDTALLAAAGDPAAGGATRMGIGHGGGHDNVGGLRHDLHPTECGEQHHSRERVGKGVGRGGEGGGAGLGPVKARLARKAA